MGAVDVMTDGTVICAVGNQIKSSTNNGTTWSNLGTIATTSVRRIFVDSRDYIFASGPAEAGSEGLYRSTDGGANFTKVLAMDADCLVWGIDEDASGNLYAGEYSQNDAGAMQIWKSTNSGANWVQKYTNSEAGYDEHHIHDIRVNPATGYIYASTGDKTPSGTNILLRSVDAGENWSVIYTGTQVTAFAFLGSYVYVGSDDGGVTPQRVYRFTDNGGASVTLEDAYLSPAGYSSFFYCAAEDDANVLMGQAEAGHGNFKLLAYDGFLWLDILSAADATWGFSVISRHHNDYFYVCGPNLSYRVKRL